MTEWCSHITWQEYGSSRAERGGFWGYSDSQKHPTNICKNWVECPECKAVRPVTPRPKEAKRLAQVLKDTNSQGVHCGDGLDQYFEKLASSAIAHIVGMMDSISCLNEDSTHLKARYYKDALKKRLLEEVK